MTRNTNNDVNEGGNESRISHPIVSAYSGRPSYYTGTGSRCDMPYIFDSAYQRSLSTAFPFPVPQLEREMLDSREVPSQTNHVFDPICDLYLA